MTNKEYREEFNKIYLAECGGNCKWAGTFTRFDSLQKFMKKYKLTQKKAEKILMSEDK